jgi:predicted protein tyrosine phosphatase
MKGIYVCDRSSVSEYTSKYGITHVLSLLDPGRKPFLHPKFDKNNWKMVHFEDVFHTSNLYAPTYEDVENCLNWAKALPDDAVLLVHCEAGVSRSTAMALAILTLKGGVDNIKQHIEHLLEIRPHAIPNSLISKYADQYLNAGGKLFELSEELANSKLTSILGFKYDRY